MYWRVKLVADDDLANEWAIVELAEGDFLAIVRKSDVDREPGRITAEVVEELERLGCPTDPPAVRRKFYSAA